MQKFSKINFKNAKPLLLLLRCCLTTGISADACRHSVP